MARHRILIIEDNAMNMELAVDLLEAAGHEVFKAMEAETGVELARSHQPELILMDVSLPGMDGLAATQELKADPATRNIPIVALTAHAMDGDSDSILAAGIDRYMTKPLRKAAIGDVLAEFCPAEARPLLAEPEAMTGT